MLYFFLLLLATVASANQPQCRATYGDLNITYQRVKNIDEYYFCFGYHHGKDRAWEMDYFRRVGEGRNAEIYGFSWLKSDLMMRMLNLPKLADRLYSELPEENKKWLVHYARGVNLGFKEGKNAREFIDLGYGPEEWKPEHSILVLTLQSFDQTRKAFFRDYEEEKLREYWKEKTEALFDEDQAPWLNTILKSGEYKRREKSKVVLQTPPISRPGLWAEFPEVFGKESGSNNWAVSKKKSKTGHALLANDPHLDLKTPLFWYWINLEGPGFKIMGASVPGVPVIASGTNGKVAWGLTNAYINTADAVFVTDLSESELETFRPLVKVKFGFFHLPFFFKSFERTREGNPILPLETESKHKLLLKWSGFQLAAKDILPMFRLLSPKNVNEMDKELQKVGLPAWNFVFADTKGDIGYRMVGHAYRMMEKDSYGISTQHLSEFRRQEFLSPEERPHVIRPRREYVYTANNRHFPADAKFYGGRGYSYSFRGFRIEELLSPDRHDLESFKAIQCDRQAVDARFFVPKLLKLIDVPEWQNWRFDTLESSKAAPLYRRLMDLMMENWKLNEYALYRYLDNLSSKERSELKSLLLIARQDVAGRNWGEFHRLTFAHMSKKGDWAFSPELPGIGDHHSVDPGSVKWDEERKLYEQFSGASMRMIIELKEEPQIYLALPGLNRNYAKIQPTVPAWKEWRDCRYQRVKF